MIKDYAPMLGAWVFWIGRKKKKYEDDVLHERRLHQIPLWTGLVAPSPSSAICNHLQRQNHSIEFIDSIDISTPIYGDWIENETPYIQGRVYGQPSPLSYTEKVVGSSPILHTRESLGVCFFIREG
jgi:hypothetical protein